MRSSVPFQPRQTIKSYEKRKYECTKCELEEGKYELPLHGYDGMTVCSVWSCCLYRDISGHTEIGFAVGLTMLGSARTAGLEKDTSLFGQRS